MSNEKPLILAVDDEPNNVKLLNQLLSSDYTIRVALNGKDALERSLIEPLPDIILLDVMMPDMDGYETCRRLKECEVTKNIPVIFLTAKTEIDDLIQGFKVGAVDYLTKPFHLEELSVRISTHLELKFNREKIEEQQQKLIRAAAIRDDVDRIMQHDLKGPLTAVIGIPEILIFQEKLSEDGVESLNIIKQSGERMLSMITLSLDLFRMERGLYQLHAIEVDIVPIISSILIDLNPLIKHKVLVIKQIVNGKPIEKDFKSRVLGERILCYTVFMNILKNAVEASDPFDVITISYEDGENSRISVHNTKAVPHDLRDNFFEKYATLGKDSGTGLGTYSAKLVTESLNGKIEMDTSDLGGTTVMVILPVVKTSRLNS